MAKQTRGLLALVERGRDLLSRTKLRLLGVKTYALVGESGTGKSFQAQSIASLLGCPYIIDDGLLIHEQKIVAGKTAKNEVSPLKAVRRAVFQNEEHARAVRDQIRMHSADRIMVIGTSEKMARLICERLDLPQPAKIVRIEEISRPEELMAARESREVEGKHVIPAAQVEVKRVFSHTIVASISHLISSYRLYRHPPRTFEKSIVHPGYYMGRLTISATALESLVKVVLEQHDPSLQIRQVRCALDEGRMDVYAEVAVALTDNLPTLLNQLQHLVVSQVRQFTGMHVERVDLNVVDVLPPAVEVTESKWRFSGKKKRKALQENSKKVRNELD
ncbi:MAG: hypothetical protein HY788_22025 [Deltaproteobacteria bacterium]|nr:hypothetical protein [Deltaproteobacteria bacterium]